MTRWAHLVLATILLAGCRGRESKQSTQAAKGLSDPWKTNIISPNPDDHLHKMGIWVKEGDGADFRIGVGSINFNYNGTGDLRETVYVRGPTTRRVVQTFTVNLDGGGSFQLGPYTSELLDDPTKPGTISAKFTYDSLNTFHKLSSCDRSTVSTSTDDRENRTPAKSP